MKNVNLPSISRLFRSASRSSRAATRPFLIIIILIQLSNSTWAFNGTEGASFLDIPVGGGPAAMAGAYTAQAADAYAPVYNPAGLGFLPSTQIAGQHLSYLETIHYEFLSGVHPFKKAGGALGFSTQYLGSGDITHTNDLGDILGTYSSHYASYNVSYGRKYTRKLSLGMTAKMIEAKINDTSAHAFAADLGSFYRYNENLDLAATITNIGTKLKFVDQADPLPLAVHVGGAFWPSPHWNTGMEVVYHQYGLASVHTAVEWIPISLISLRTGFRTDTIRELGPMAGLTLGMGLHLWGSEFDYAWVPMGDLGTTQYFSLVIRFWPIEVPEPKRNLIHFQRLRGGMVRRPYDSQPYQEDAEAMIDLLADQGEKKSRTAQAPKTENMLQIIPDTDPASGEREMKHDQ